MKQLEVTWKGVSPLLMHDCRTVNPLHPMTKEKSKYTSKRKKTDEDHAIISDLEWLSGLYYTEDLNDVLNPAKDAYIYVPAVNIEATIKAGATANKRGKDIAKFVQVMEDHVRLEFYDNRPVSEVMKDFRYRDVRQVNVQRNKITRTRPRFDRWAITFTLSYDDSHIDVETIVTALEYAGAYVGTGDFRPRYGKFESIIEEL